MPFCSAAIQYPACVPKYQTLPPMKEFPSGRWYNHTILAKDQWIETSVTNFIRERISLEKNKTLKAQRMNEFGDPGKIKRRFGRNPTCQAAYKNLFCWLNFPRCDDSRDLTLPTCKSACENFFRVCLYETDLWRCGKSKYFNGYAPEVPTVDAMGNVNYLREYMPGQPFRQNKYTTGGNEIPICTPAITGKASSHLGSYSWMFSSVMAFIALLILSVTSITG